ncbi:MULTISPECIES: hypothetical protein [unclassified Bradyrhizobium]|uniref:hypothetical protein n=1 Tax=unclassified Bradyrhizobium TaxID=2631580 RepID=UPI001FF97F2A|nr:MULTISPECIES: hypothetical protein [unclassified Bradyrhizobium]MCK1710792.1 hypothetical protein [Bradyrhizobium sp. 143]MCK1724470.1 hypothetical protein [Bradyrhizobium sp. 142]
MKGPILFREFLLALDGGSSPRAIATRAVCQQWNVVIFVSLDEHSTAPNQNVSPDLKRSVNSVTPVAITFDSRADLKKD